MSGCALTEPVNPINNTVDDHAVYWNQAFPRNWKDRVSIPAKPPLPFQLNFARRRYVEPQGIRPLFGQDNRLNIVQAR